MNREILKRTGVDYNIGIKMLVLMQQAGLVNIWKGTPSGR
jgi:hypothetical protein